MMLLARYREVRMSEHVQAVTTCAGDPAWQVRGYETVKRLLTDPRLGRTHPQPERAPRYSNSLIFGRPQPATPTEADDHARMRKLLAPWFSPRRLAALRPRVQELVDELLDGLCGQSPPVDFHEAVSFPFPALVICELLGVPYEDRQQFRRWSDDAADMSDERRSMSGLAALWQYMQDLVEAKRREPGDDVLSELVRAEAQESKRSSSDEAATLGAGLLFAGHETTVAAIDKGVVRLLGDRASWERLQRQPALVADAVEEILRLPLAVPEPEPNYATGLPRWAKAHIDLGGVTVRAGELVLLDLQDANLDEQVFAEPEHLELPRTPNPHLTFGHGPYFCLGAPLARMELRVLFSSLVHRLRNARLAVPLEDLRPRTNLLTGGLHALPLTW